MGFPAGVPENFSTIRERILTAFHKAMVNIEDAVIAHSGRQEDTNLARLMLLASVMMVPLVAHSETRRRSHGTVLFSHLICSLLFQDLHNGCGQ